MAGGSPFAGSETVLVVDDNDDARHAMRRTLEWHGYRVLTAASPHTAREIVDAESGSIDLLVTDVVMPGMTGPTLGRALREVMPSLRILLVSGYTERELTSEGLSDHDTDFLQKPLTIRQLAEAVRTLLDRPDRTVSGP